MLFNSNEFIFGFLPAALLLYVVLGRGSRNLALSALIVASVVFYAWWRPENVLVIVLSLAVNYCVAAGLVHLRGASPTLKSKLLLGAGIAFNVGLLGYFKYANFAKVALNDLMGTDLVLTQIILPLGISFITFQEIAFLIDVHGRRVESFSLREFCLFILFFPQLIAGPIVHFNETMPQFRDPSPRDKWLDLSAGSTLFCLGLFKKVVLADGIAAHVSPIYGLAADGGTVSLIPAWIAAVGFTLQIYFDFSAYSDMATGIARCFGIRLPLNFDSPLKASSIIDFWLRWHVTLTRFLTAYIYNPLVLRLTRRRLAGGLPGFGGRGSNIGGFLTLLAGPTVLTMVVSGLWHGAGYLFLLWGLLHGIYLVINHGWRWYAKHRWNSSKRYQRIMARCGWLLTFVAVAVAMVLFRSPSVAAASEVLQGMLGLNGLTLPQQILARLGRSELLAPFITADATAASALATSLAWIFGLLAIALLLPNSLEFMARYEPVLRSTPTRAADGSRVTRSLRWTPTVPWLVAIAALAATSLWRLGGPSEFLYWQF